MKKHQRSMLSLQLQGKQMLALLLSAILLFASLPLAAIAEGTLPQEEGGAPQIYDDIASAETAEGEVMEVESLREANVKHFYMGDGTYRAVSYGSAVHRKDAAGVWQEIDNTLTLQNGYHTTPDGRIKLASSSTAEGSLLQIAENGYGIDMAMLPPSEPAGDMSMDMNANATLHTGSVTIQNAQREAVLETDSAEIQYQKLSKTLNHSKLTYANLSAGLDVSYELSGNKITERIVVKGARDSYDFAFRLSLTGLTATLDEENTITFADAITGAAVYTMPAPAMTDLVSGTTHAAAYELMALDEESYLLIVSVDAELANEILTADDTATLGGNGGIELCAVISNTVDSSDPITYTYISAEEPNSTASENDVRISWGYKGYVLYDIPAIPDYAYFDGAELQLVHTCEESCTLQIYRCNYAWYNDDSWTYNAAQARGDWGMSTTDVKTCVAAGNNEIVSVDFSNWVLDWLDGAANHGFAIVPVENTLLSLFSIYPDDGCLAVTYRYTAHQVDEGIYYLQNAMYDRFMQVSDDGNISARLFEDLDTQKWMFTSIDSDFYKISPMSNPDWVLTASSNNIGASLYLQEPSNGILNEYQQWRLLSEGDHIVLCPRASYQLTSSAIPERCLGVSPGSNLVKVFSNTDTHSLDEGWFLRSLVRVNAIFDESYKTRYGPNDSGISQLENVRNRIDQHMEYLKQEYFERFGIIVEYAVANDDFVCYACRSCSCGYDPTSSIINGINCKDWWKLSEKPNPNDSDTSNDHIAHHTNCYNIGRAIREDPTTPSDMITIAFIGHDTCDEDSTILDHFNNITGIAYNNAAMYGSKFVATIHNRSAIIKGWEFDEDYNKVYFNVAEQVSKIQENTEIIFDNTDFERETLLHEFGHFFKAPDHYDDAEDGLNDNNYTLDEINSCNTLCPSGENFGKGQYHDNCIYGTDRWETAMGQNNAICAGCQSVILAHANDYAYLFSLNQD